MERNDLGSRIARRRKDLGMTQRDLAERLHVTDRAVSRWERGIGSPDISLLAPLASVLKISIDELVTGTVFVPTSESPSEWQLRKKEREKKRLERLAYNAPRLGYWLWFLVLLFIPVLLVSSLIGEDIKQHLLPAYITGKAVMAVCSVAYGLILLKLSCTHEYYKTAGIFYLLAFAVNSLTEFFEISFLSVWLQVLILLPGVVLSCFSTYHEYMAHSAVLEDLDMSLSDKWDFMWKLYIGAAAGVLVGTVLAEILPVVGLLLITVAGLGILIEGCMFVYCLYKTAKLFRNYPAEWK